MTIALTAQANIFVLTETASIFIGPSIILIG